MAAHALMVVVTVLCSAVWNIKVVPWLCLQRFPLCISAQLSIVLGHFRIVYILNKINVIII